MGGRLCTHPPHPGRGPGGAGDPDRAPPDRHQRAGHPPLRARGHRLVRGRGSRGRRARARRWCGRAVPGPPRGPPRARHAAPARGAARRRADGGLGRGRRGRRHRFARAGLVRRRRRDSTRHVGAALALAVPAHGPARADPERLRPRLCARRGRVRLRSAADHGPGGHRRAGIRADRIRGLRALRHGAPAEDAPLPARPGARRPRQLGARARGARRAGSPRARVRQRSGRLHARVDRGGAPGVQRGRGLQGAGRRAPRESGRWRAAWRAWPGACAERISRSCGRT